MIKNEMAFRLAKEISLLSKQIELTTDSVELSGDQEFQNELCEKFSNEIIGIKKSARALNVDVEVKVMPIVRHLNILNRDEIKEITFQQFCYRVGW